MFLLLCVFLFCYFILPHVYNLIEKCCSFCSAQFISELELQVRWIKVYIAQTEGKFTTYDAKHDAVLRIKPERSVEIFFSLHNFT